MIDQNCHRLIHLKIISFDFPTLNLVSYTNKKLSLTNRATHSCKRNGVAVLLKHVPPNMSPCRIWSFSVKRCRHRGLNTEEPQKLGSAGTPLSWNGRRGWPEDTCPSPTLCYLDEFGRSALKDVGINMGKLPKLRSAGTGLPHDLKLRVLGLKN